MVVGDGDGATRSLVVRFFAAGGAIAEVVVVFEDGLEEGGPFLLGYLLVPLVDLLMATEGTEFVEEFGELLGLVQEAGVVVEEKLGAAGEGEGDFGDGGCC